MGLESASEREFAQLMSYHVLGHIDRNEGTTVVDVEIQSDEVGSDRRAARPSLNGLAGTIPLRLFNLFHQARIDEETFFNGTCHGAISK